MLPTVAKLDDKMPERLDRRVLAVTHALDQALFSADGWFAIDVDNRRVPRVVVASREAGLELVGKGAVATIVGRVRDGVVVVDVDVEGVRGHGICEAIVSWCVAEGVWHLLRPSGGSDGRAHLFVAHAGYLDALEALLGGLRDTYRVGRSAIDLRTAVRPLAAPHRTGRYTHPSGPLKERLAALKSLPGMGGVSGRTGAPSGLRTKAGRRRPPVAALAPRRRRQRRDLPEPWARFLGAGVRPQLRDPAPGAPAHSRSTWEAICTAMMVRAGWTADEAWQAIEAAHPAAMDHARGSRARWTQWVWNRAVLDDDAHSPRPTPTAVVQHAVDVAHERLKDLAWTLPPRQRPALLSVGRAILTRVHRTDTARVPVPERDLVLDTGITDRKTIRTQLRILDGVMGHLHRDCFDPAAKRDSSSYEFEIPSGVGLSKIPPPGRHTPLARPLPLGCPRACAQLLVVLLESDAPAELSVVLQRAQLTNSPTAEPTVSQVRTGKAALAELVRLGQAWCTEGGQWFARADTPPPRTQAGDTRRADLAVTIAAERAAYRAPRADSWTMARAAAAKVQAAKEKAWWGGLSDDERARRRARWRHKFEGLSVSERAAVAARLAERDRGRGVDLARRHDMWLDGLPMDRYLTRSIERQASFAALPQPLQVAAATAWRAHRERFGIPRGSALAAGRREWADSLPQGPEERDAAFIQAELGIAHQKVG